VRSGEHAELSRARARIKELEGELEMTRKASALFEEQAEGRPVVHPNDRAATKERASGEERSPPDGRHRLKSEPTALFV
jgi:hypothetical protein